MLVELVYSYGVVCAGLVAYLATVGKFDVTCSLSTVSSVGGYSSTEDAFGAGKITSVKLSVWVSGRLAWCT